MEIDPGKSYMKLRGALARAAKLSRQAMDAEHAWKNRAHATEKVTHPDEFWRKLFGEKYPRAGNVSGAPRSLSRGPPGTRWNPR